MIYRFSVGRLDCTVLSDGQPGPPLETPLEMFFTPGSGVPEPELRAAVAAEGTGRGTLTCGYNCLLVQTTAGQAVIDSGLGPQIPWLWPRHAEAARGAGLGDRLTEAGSAPPDLAAVLFTHLHQDHSRGAVWSGELAFPAATGFAHAAEVAFWSDAARSADDPHLAAAREAIRLFGDRLRPFEYDTEIMPGIRTVGAAAYSPATPRCCCKAAATGCCARGTRSTIHCNCATRPGARPAGSRRDRLGRQPAEPAADGG